MARADTRAGRTALSAGLVVIVALALHGCGDKPTALQEEPYTVALMGDDVNRDGTLSNEALQKIQAKSGEKKLHINFIRTPLSDAGLNQLAKFPNLRRVTAIGSPVTPAGMEKLKRAIPEVEVVVK
jgi:hypothetical protein